MAAFLETTGAAEASSTPRNALSALRAQLHALADAFAAPAGRSVAAMVAGRPIGDRTRQGFPQRIHRAQPRRYPRAPGTMRSRQGNRAAAGRDIELTLDLVFGPLFYRLLMGHGAYHAELRRSARRPGHPRTMHLKPTWLVVVSICSRGRAAGAIALAVTGGRRDANALTAPCAGCARGRASHSSPRASRHADSRARNRPCRIGPGCLSTYQSVVHSQTLPISSYRP